MRNHEVVKEQLLLSESDILGEYCRAEDLLNWVIQPRAQMLLAFRLTWIQDLG